MNDSSTKHAWSHADAPTDLSMKIIVNTADQPLEESKGMLAKVKDGAHFVKCVHKAQ